MPLPPTPSSGCFDGGTPRPRVGFLNVFVNVVDDNDHSPKFPRKSYDLKLLENATLGTSFLRVEATDEDEGNNGRISYFIAGGESGIGFEWFESGSK